MAIGVLIMLTLALLFVLVLNRSQKKLLVEKNERQALQLKHQQELLHSTILTQEKERKRIAKDLHDEIGSKLNVIHLNMHRLKKHDDGSDTFRETISEVKSIINKTIDTTRRISHDLLPPILEEFGLVEGIKEFTESYNHSGLINIDFQYQISSETKLGKLVELNLFRIIQELTKNSIHHGAAKNIRINLNNSTQKLALSYHDDGKGFDPKKIQKKGLGLRNLESRVDMIGASYQLQSAPGKGVNVEISIP